MGVLGWVAGLCPGPSEPASASPLLLQYVKKLPQYSYEAPSPELCRQIRSIRSVPRGRGWAAGTPVAGARTLRAPPHPAGSLLTLAALLWPRRISKVMLNWACWILTDRETDS